MLTGNPPKDCIKSIGQTQRVAKPREGGRAACKERVPKLPKGPLSSEFLNTLKGRGPHDVVTLYDQLKASIKAQSEACDAQSKAESIQQTVAKLQAQRPQLKLCSAEQRNSASCKKGNVPLINLESYNKLKADTAKLQADEKYATYIPALIPLAKKASEEANVLLAKLHNAQLAKNGISLRGCQLYSYTHRRCEQWHAGYGP